MQKIEDILEWNFRSSYMSYAANHLLTDNSKARINKSKDSLEKLIERLPDGGEIPKRESIKDVYYLFVKNYQFASFTMSNRSVRYLIWALDFKPSSNTNNILLSNKLEPALNIIKQNWKDSYIVSLWHMLLKNWTDLQSNKNSIKLFETLLKNKSKAYIGKRSNILNITQHIDLFLSTDSPKKYATLLIEKKIILSNANQLFNHKDRILNYDYFSETANRYLDLISYNNNNIDSIYVKGVYCFLEKHNSKKATLLICAKIINRNIFDNNIDIVKSETVRLISDPLKKTNWINSDLSVTEQQEVEKSRSRLKILLNKEFVEVFFKRIVEDKRREYYWLKFINDIEDIKIVGNKANYNYLKEVDSISEHVGGRYKVTSSNQNTCALIMYLKDFVFVEFSDVGALYIYKKQSFKDKVNLNAVSSIENLKRMSTYNFACKNSSSYGFVNLNSEGRITHQGDWESRVNVWMRRYI